MVVLKHRNPKKTIFWSWNSPVGWLPDAKSKGTGFDSRSCRGNFFTFWGDVLGCVWEYFGSIFGWLGQEKNLENQAQKIMKIRIIKNVWEYFSCIQEPVTSLFKVIYPSQNSVSQLLELIQNSLIRSGYFCDCKGIYLLFPIEVIYPPCFHIYIYIYIYIYFHIFQ